MGLFSDIAYKKMIELSSDTHNKVGRNLYSLQPERYKGYIRTDCTTFVLNVLKHTYAEIGQPGTAENIVNTFGMAQRGSDTKPLFYADVLYQKLVNMFGWKAIYCTPDRHHPNDGSPDHTWASRLVEKTCKYAGVRVEYTVINYNPTPETDPNFKKVTPGRGVQKLNAIDLAALKKIKFGVGMSRKGDHTWLFSLGSVYEVHWSNVGEGLYEVRKLPNFPWNANLIVVPPDMVSLLKMSSLKCS